MIKSKDSLSSLCNIINSLQPFPLDTSHFLKLKDVQISGDSAKAFWYVLHNLTCGSNCSELIDCTKLQFAKRCYKSLDFYSLSNNISSLNSSLELISAFTWLICIGIIEEKVDDIVSKALNIKEGKGFYECPTVNERKNETCNFNDVLNHLLKLSRCYSSSANFSSQKNELIFQVNEKLPAAVPSNYTSLIISLYRDETQSSAFLQKADYIKNITNLYISWKNLEKYFIQWIGFSLNELKSKRKRLVLEEMRLNAEKTKYLFQNNISLPNVMHHKFIRKDMYSADCQAFIVQENLGKIAGILHHFGLATLKYDIPFLDKQFKE